MILLQLIFSDCTRADGYQFYHRTRGKIKEVRVSMVVVEFDAIMTLTTLIASRDLAFCPGFNL